MSINYQSFIPISWNPFLIHFKNIAIGKFNNLRRKNSRMANVAHVSAFNWNYIRQLSKFRVSYKYHKLTDAKTMQQTRVVGNKNKMVEKNMVAR